MSKQGFLSKCGVKSIYLDKKFLSKFKHITINVNI